MPAADHTAKLPSEIPPDMRDRLDAAREELDVDIRFHAKGSPTSHGRAFDYWEVRLGPYGWRGELATYQADLAQRRPGEPSRVPAPRCMTIEGPDLAQALTTALDSAEKYWST